MTLRDTLDRLTADFARQVIAALQDASLDELAGRSAAGARETARGRAERPPRAPRAARAPRAGAPRATTEAPRAEPAATASATPEMKAAALRILEGRGHKGATGTQLEAELSLQGFAPASDLMSSLVESGAVRDTGFRRASGGKATSAVYVIAAPAE